MKTHSFSRKHRLKLPLQSLRLHTAEVIGSILVSGVTVAAQTDPHWQLSHQTFSETSFRGLVIADFDLDGDQDAVSSTALGIPILCKNDGNGRFEIFRSQEPRVLGVRMQILAADLDSDGDDDLVFTGGYSGFDIWLNQAGVQGGPAGEFHPDSRNQSPVNTARHPQLADFDVDGDLDLVIGHLGGLTVYWNNGTAGFDSNERIAPAHLANATTIDIAVETYQQDRPRVKFVTEGFGVPDRIFNVANRLGDPDYADVFPEELVLDIFFTAERTEMFSHTQFAIGAFANLAANHIFYVTRARLSGRGSIGGLPDRPLPDRIGSTHKHLTTGDINADGLEDVLVAGEGIRFYLGSPLDAGESLPPFSQVLAAPNLIHRAELGDFNGDGTLDIFALEGDSFPDQPLVWLSQAEPEPSYWEPLELPPVPGTFAAGAVATGDIDGDGAVDLIVPDNSNGLAIWFAEGQSYERVTYPALRNVAFVDVGDLDGDGDLDLLVTNDEREVTWWRNGLIEPAAVVSFVEVSSWSASAEIESGQPKIVDIDGNGSLDILSFEEIGTRIRISPNETLDSPLGPGQIPSIDVDSALAFAPADVDGDGDPDIIVTQRDGSVTIWWNQGGLAFTESTVLEQPLRAYSVLPADFDQDGRVDLLVDLKQVPGIQVWWNDGLSALSPASFTAMNLDHSISDRGATIRRRLLAGDVDGDGFEDIFAGGGGIAGGALYVNQKDRTFQRQGAEYFAPANALTDVNGDDRADAIFSYFTPTGQGALYLLRSGTQIGGGEEFHLALSAATLSESIHTPYAIGDIDSDGDDDIVSVSAESSGSLIYHRSDDVDLTGNGSFSVHSIDAQVRSYTSIRMTDIDGDGDLDIVAFAGNPLISFFLGDGQGDFVAVPIPGMISEAINAAPAFTVPTLQLADVDADGFLDVFLIFSGGGANRVFVNRSTLEHGATPGQLQLEESPIPNPERNPIFERYRLISGDFDADGDADLLYLFDTFVNGDKHRTLSVWTNMGGLQRGEYGLYEELPGNFAANISPSGSLPGIVAVDLNRDGYDDLVIQKDGRTWLHINRTQGALFSEALDRFNGSIDFSNVSGHNSAVPLYRKSGPQNGATELWRPTRSGELVIDQTILTNGQPRSGDFNGDGYLDVITDNKVWLKSPDAPILRLSGLLPHDWFIRTAQLGKPMTNYQHASDARISARLDSEAQQSADPVSLSFSYDRRTAGRDPDGKPAVITTRETVEVLLAPNAGAPAMVTIPYDLGLWNSRAASEVKEVHVTGNDVVIAASSVLPILFGRDVAVCTVDKISEYLDPDDDDDDLRIRLARDEAPPDDDPFFLSLLRQFRDQTLGSTAQGRYYTQLYYANGSSAMDVIANRPGALLETFDAVRAWVPAITAAIQDKSDSVTITKEMHDTLMGTIEMFKEYGAPQFAELVEREAVAVGVSDLQGRSFGEALERMQNRKLPDNFEHIDIDAKSDTGKVEISQTTTTVSQKYQIYGSDDLINFEPVGDSTSGDGGPISWLLERGRDLRKFFLIKSIGFDGEE